MLIRYHNPDYFVENHDLLIAVTESAENCFGDQEVTIVRMIPGSQPEFVSGHATSESILEAEPWLSQDEVTEQIVQEDEAKLLLAESTKSSLLTIASSIALKSYNSEDYLEGSHHENPNTLQHEETVYRIGAYSWYEEGRDDADIFYNVSSTKLFGLEKYGTATEYQITVEDDFLEESLGVILLGDKPEVAMYRLSLPIDLHNRCIEIGQVAFSDLVSQSNPGSYENDAYKIQLTAVIDQILADYRDREDEQEVSLLMQEARKRLLAIRARNEEARYNGVYRPTASQLGRIIKLMTG